MVFIIIFHAKAGFRFHLLFFLAVFFGLVELKELGVPLTSAFRLFKPVSDQNQSVGLAPIP